MFGSTLSRGIPRILVLFSLLSGTRGDCGPPPKLKNTVLTTDVSAESFPDGTSITYKCMQGFYNVYGKRDVTTCYSIHGRSQWTEVEDFCEGSCLNPTRVRFAQVKPGDSKTYYIAGTNVSYICHSPYDTIPGISPLITCLPNYTWSELPVFCKGKSCGDPGNPEHGSAVILTDLLYLAKVNFVCDEGYKLIGSQSIQCVWKETRVEWNKNTPNCEPTTTLATPVTTLTTPRSLTTELLRKDKSSGNCNRPDAIPYAQLRSGTLKDSYDVGTTLTYRCIPGYELISGVRPQIQCLETSKWSEEAPRFCQGKRCRDPDFENGRFTASGDGRIGDVLTYVCNEGYRLIGRKTANCVLVDNNVAWNYEAFCQRIPCFPPPEIANGNNGNDGRAEYDYGSVVTYTCARGYSLIGSKNLVCVVADNGVDGKWNKDPPECKVVSCPRPNIAHGSILGPFQASYTYENSITIRCDEGYSLTGDSQVKCGADNSWNPPLPKCSFGIITTVVPPGGGGKNETSPGPTTESTVGPTTGTKGKTGSTQSPESPKDESGPNNSTAIAVGAVVGAIFLIAVIVLALKCRAHHVKKGKANIDRPGPANSYDVVSQNPEIVMEEKSPPRV